MDQQAATNFHDIPYATKDIRPGLLVIADADGRDGFAALADAAGLRLQAVVSLAEGAAQLEMQSGCDVAMLVCAVPDPSLERLLVQLDTIAAMGEMRLLVVSALESLDMAYALIRSGRVQLLCQPDATDLSVALVAVRSSERIEPTLNDISRESESARLQRLSEEVGRLARTLDALTAGHGLAMAAPAVSFASLPGGRVSDHPSAYIGMPALGPMGGAAVQARAHGQDSVTAAQVRDLLRARRMRADFLSADLFADPAWDMLLDLLAAQLDGMRVSVSSLCIAAAVPPTTALRWIKTLTDKGLVDRRADPQDGRRVFIALADETAEALRNWFVAGRRLLNGAAGV
jgi:DNA-binding MarR family transcriptional regulator